MSSLLESGITLRIKHRYMDQARAYRISLEIKTPQAGEDGILLLRNGHLGDAYSSGHLVLSHFGTCMCSNVETNLS